MGRAVNRLRAARPVLKWAGGKAQLVDHILPLLPREIRTYHEPFCGGGAVFFALAAQGRFKRAVLSDSNPELIDVYRAIRENVDAVIGCLRDLELHHSEQKYYAVRESNPRRLDRRAARTIYLNKTGYNGLYRVNRSGAFNVPFGRYTRPKICDEPNLRRVSEVLRSVELRVGDFEARCKSVRQGDAVYFDPPYLPLSRTASFVSYDRHPFGWPEHQRLARVFERLANREICVVLSNSDTPGARELYEQWHIAPAWVARPINSRASARGPVRELLVVGNRPAKASRRERGQ